MEKGKKKNLLLGCLVLAITFFALASEEQLSSLVLIKGGDH